MQYLRINFMQQYMNLWSSYIPSGERLIQYASENLVTEVLIHPQTNTFIQCMRNLLSSFTRHRHIIHAGYTFTGNGSWILQVWFVAVLNLHENNLKNFLITPQDGTFSVLDFCDEFLQNEVQRVLRAYTDTISIDIHCAQLGHWSSLPDKNFTKLCKIRINPVEVLDSGNDKLNAFVGEFNLVHHSMMKFPSLFSLNFHALLSTNTIFSS